MGKINFGNIVNQGNKTIANDVTGIGIDASALIKTQLAPQEKKLQDTKDTIDLNVKKLGAYAELRNLLSNLKNINDQLKFDTRNNPLLKNTFDSKTTKVMSTDGLSNNYIEILPNNECPIGEYELTIIRLATAKKTISDPFLTNTTDITGVGAGLFNVGTFTINNVPITITPGDNLINIVSKINLIQNTANIQAYIVQVSASDYRIVLQSTKSGLANSFIINDPTGVLNNINFNDILPQNAQINFNSIPITSPDNVVENVISGLVLNLLHPTPPGVTINFKVENDRQAASEALTKFQAEYNNFIEFYNKQTAKKIDDNFTFREDAILAKESILQTIYDQIRNITTNPIIIPNETKYTTLSSIGISVLSSNATSIKDYKGLKLTHRMEIDFYKLNPILATDFEKVKTIFSTKFNSTSSSFGLLRSSNNSKINNFSLDVDISRVDSSSDGKVRAIYTINGVTTTILPQYQILTNQIGGNNDIKIKGSQNTVLEGLEILFVNNGTGIGQTDITITQGMSDKISNFLEKILDEGSGSLKKVENNLYSDNRTQKDKSQDQELTLNKEKERLLKRYAQIQGNVKNYNLQLESLKAWNEAQKNNK